MDAPEVSEEELLRYFSRPERVSESIEANADLFYALDELGAFGEPGEFAGLEVNLSEIDGEISVEQRLYYRYEYGTLSIAISPDDFRGGARAYVVTDEQRMEAAPFEWSPEATTELPDERRICGFDLEGWTGAGIENPEILEDALDDEEITVCTDPGHAPIEGQCMYVGCLGRVQVSDGGACPSTGSEDSSPCIDSEYCRQHCWEIDGMCLCIDPFGRVDLDLSETCENHTG